MSGPSGLQSPGNIFIRLLAVADADSANFEYRKTASSTPVRSIEAVIFLVGPTGIEPMTFTV